MKKARDLADFGRRRGGGRLRFGDAGRRCVDPQVAAAHQEFPISADGDPPCVQRDIAAQDLASVRDHTKPGALARGCRNDQSFM